MFSPGRADFSSQTAGDCNAKHADIAKPAATGQRPEAAPKLTMGHSRHIKDRANSALDDTVQFETVVLRILCDCAGRPIRSELADVLGINTLIPVGQAPKGILNV